VSSSKAQLVKKIFQEAAERIGDDRAKFLADHCGGDVHLRREVEKLLDQDASANTRFLQGGISTPRERPIPQRIAHFQILRLVGEGGMGSVFEAQQDHPRRIVALKVIRMAMASESVRRRFEYEVQILGQLKHPGIAQIYEAGTHDDGTGPLPYFAMEFIRGPSLLNFAKTNKLTTRQRLSLLAEICDAVHHAHQKGVVHRDLKPANILVESEGGVPQPKILDFGVARATQSDLQQVTMHTEVGQIIGTLSYMSPEQVAGKPEDLDVRSDVYALGVLLFELLGERLPYDLRGRSLPEAGEIIRDQEPSRLSSIQSAFRGDIETIVAKALEKAKERRYQSAAELADDIRRFLRDEPIVARPASRAYQIRKFAKRNKAIVLGVAAVFLSLILGIIGTSIALVRATKAEAVALDRSNQSLRSAAKATAVNSFLQEMLSSVDPAKSLGKEVTIIQALNDAAAKIEAGSLSDEPEIEADLRTTIGTTFHALGHYASAEPHLRAALDIRRKHYGDAHPEVARSLESLAQVLGVQGRHAEAEPMIYESLKILRQAHGERHVEVASVMQGLGAALRSQAKYDQAEPMYREALAIRRELLGEEHLDVAQSINSLALLLQNKNDFAGAEPLFRQALAIRRKQLGETHPVVADAMNNLANLLHYRENDSEAEALMEQALEMRKKLLGADHPQFAQSVNNFAVFLNDKGDYEKSEPMYRQALAIWRRTLPANHSDIGNAAAGLGQALTALGDYAEAETLLREALAIRESTLPEDHWYRFTTKSALGAALAEQGKYAEAEGLVLTGYENLKNHPKVGPKTKRIALGRVIRLYELWGKPEKAAEWKEVSATK
jgi:eukaryotic-like serine/threonine-protein kinase